MEWAPQELFPIAPPTFPRLLVLGSGREEHAVRLQVVIELVQHYPRLGPDPAGLGVDLQHPSHVLGEVDDYGVSDRLSGETRPPATWKHGDPVAVGSLDHGHDVVRIPGDDDA